MIPPMALVSKLTIVDAYHSRMTASEAQPFNIALLQRLPNLRGERFWQERRAKSRPSSPPPAYGGL